MLNIFFKKNNKYNKKLILELKKENKNILEYISIIEKDLKNGLLGDVSLKYRKLQYMISQKALKEETYLYTYLKENKIGLDIIEERKEEINYFILRVLKRTIKYKEIKIEEEKEFKIELEDTKKEFLKITNKQENTEYLLYK